jgi:GT2 family glycosyltransferase
MNTQLSTEAEQSAADEDEPLPTLAPVLPAAPAVTSSARPAEAPVATAAAAPIGADPDIGFVDLYGSAGSLAGWIFCGWIGRLDELSGAETEVTVRFDQGEITGKAMVAFFPREDLADRGCGMLLFADIKAPSTWDLRQLSVAMAGAEFKANGGFRSRKLKPADLAGELKPIVQDRLPPGEAKQALTTLLSRVYSGKDTLPSLEPAVRLEIDEAILCPPDGLWLVGWRLFAPGVVKRVRAGSGATIQEIRFEHCVPIARPEVAAQSLVSNLPFQNVRCGFAAYVPHCLTDGEPPYLEVETCGGEVVTRPIRLLTLAGIDAIKRVLSDVEVRFDELDRGFDEVLGPAVASLNAGRLVIPCSPETLEFGTIANRPRCSVIVPLYGRIDFLEYQMALWSLHSAHAHVEYIYVLDDPPRRRELENLAHSVFARYQIPFRLLLLPYNLGYGPASNHGLRSARGDYVCFLNSDVFPGTPDWIERLTAHLAQHTNIGVIGPRLLYEDGTIQHEGCIYRPLKEFGGWMYVDHDQRGRLPGPEHGLRNVPAITGACMVMQRWLAEELRGFDEAYIIGDFEDSDLCKRILAYGLTCAVDRDVHLYHLERQSQSGSAQRWRQNLTLYNGWVHQRRWYPAGSST